MALAGLRINCSLQELERQSREMIEAWDSGSTDYNIFLQPANHFKSLKLVVAYTIIRPADTPPSIQLVESVARQILDKRTKYTKPCQVYDWWYKRGLPDPDDDEEEDDANDGNFEAQEQNDRNDDSSGKEEAGEETDDEEVLMEIDAEDDLEVTKPARRKVGELDMSDEAIATRNKYKQIDARTRAMFGSDNVSNQEKPLSVVTAMTKEATTPATSSEKVKVYVSGKLVDRVEVEDTIVVQPRTAVQVLGEEKSVMDMSRDIFHRKNASAETKVMEATVAPKPTMEINGEDTSPKPGLSPLFASSPIVPQEREDRPPEKFSLKLESSPVKKPSKKRKSTMEKFKINNQEFMQKQMRQPVSQAMPLHTKATPLQALTPITQKIVESFYREPRLTSQELSRFDLHGINLQTTTAAFSTSSVKGKDVAQAKMLVSPTKSAKQATTIKVSKENARPVPTTISHVQHTNPLGKTSFAVPSSSLGKHARSSPLDNQTSTVKQKKNSHDDKSLKSRQRAPSAVGVTGYAGSAYRGPPRSAAEKEVA